MQLPVNAFKQALREGRAQIGLWVGLADPAAAELLAGAGFDWLVIDAEHSPNDLRSVLPLLQAVAPYPFIRSCARCTARWKLIKQYLDIGVQTLLVPMIETAEQAERIVAATRYPPRGIRGVASATTRATRWRQIDRYFERAEAEICVLVQVESVKGLENLQAIASVDGVDGVFFGPADLAASMGLIGKPMDPAVRAAVAEGIAAVSHGRQGGGDAHRRCEARPRLPGDRRAVRRGGHRHRIAAEGGGRSRGGVQGEARRMILYGYSHELGLLSGADRARAQGHRCDAGDQASAPRRAQAEGLPADQPPGLRARARLGRRPGLTQSLAIIEYLDEVYPQPAVAPRVSRSSVPVYGP